VNSRFFSGKKIDQLLKDTQELDNIKKDNKLSIELNMQKTFEVINKA
jgi:hypothetical protein